MSRSPGVPEQCGGCACGSARARATTVAARTADPASHADAAATDGAVTAGTAGTAQTAGPAAAAKEGVVRAAAATSAADATVVAGAAGRAVQSGGAGPASTTGPTGAEQRQQLPVDTTGAAGPSEGTNSASAASTSITAADKSIGPPGPTATRGPQSCCGISAGPTIAPCAPQCRRTASSTLPAGPAGAAIAAAAEQPAAVTAVLPGPRRAIGAVAEQRAARQIPDRIPRRRRPQQILGLGQRRHVRCLGRRVRPCATRQRLNELVVK
jgi:hypothetical protein